MLAHLTYCAGQPRATGTLACTTNACRLAVPALRPVKKWVSHGGRPSALAATQSSTAAAADPRKALKTAIADQLTGPHFETWLDPRRFEPTRVVMQARRLWYYSTLLLPCALGTDREFTPLQLAQLQSAAITAFADLQRFRLPSGGWRFSRSLDPGAFPEDKVEVCMYAVFFVLYALATYYAAVPSDHALILANELFDNIAARLARDGGVAPEAYEGDFIHTLGDGLAERPVQNSIGHYNDRRSVNSHIHLLESLTAYHALVPAGAKGDARQARSAAALKAAADLVVAMKDGPRMVELRDMSDATKPWLQAASNLTAKEKFMFLPGHNVEATFLVHDAYDVLGLPGPDDSFTKDILAEARAWMQGNQPLRWLPHVCVNTRDTNPSGGKEAWSIGTSSWESEVPWWVQMELLNALVHADQRLGGPGRSGDEYIEWAAEVWQLVSTKFVDHKTGTGALYQGLDHNLQPLHDDATYGPWKASYHSSRAMVRSLQALSTGFKGLQAPPAA